MSLLRRLLVVVATATLTAATLGVGGAAHADQSFPTYGSGVRVRADATTTSAVVGTLANAERITVDCQKLGQTVTVGNASSPWWAHVPSKGGYVTVAYVDIPESKLPNVPECGGTQPPPSGRQITYGDLITMFPGKVGPQSTVETGLPSLNAEMAAGQINTPYRQAAFLATIANESTFRYDADQGTGSTYTGRGFIQLTGDFNYRAAGDYFGINLLGNPALAKSLDYSAKISNWYWNVNRDINPLADNLDMGRVNDAIGYANDSAEDVQRCNDFKAALQYLNGSVPGGINCVRPAMAPADRADGTQDQDARQFGPRMKDLLEDAGR